jgi:3-hydroxybutyryl-CoA dehydrogenase
MGSGIAQVAAQAGHDVVLRDVTDAALQRGLDGIRTSYERFVAKDKLSAADAEAALGRITTTTDLEAAADADIVVEAVFETLEVKAEVFGSSTGCARTTRCSRPTPAPSRSRRSPRRPSARRASSARTSSVPCR